MHEHDHEINTCSELPVCPLTTHKHRYIKPRPNACVGGNTYSFFLSWVIIRWQKNLLKSLRSLVHPDFTMCKNCAAFSLTEERPGFHQGKFKCFSPLGRSTMNVEYVFKINYQGVSPCFHRLFILHGGKHVGVLVGCCFFILRWELNLEFCILQTSALPLGCTSDSFWLLCPKTESYIELTSPEWPCSWGTCAWKLSLEDVFLHVKNIWKALFSPQVQSKLGETIQSVQCLPH